MFYTLDVPYWSQVLDTSDFPHEYLITFAAFLSTFVSIIAPWNVTEAIISKLADLMLPDDLKDFLINKYLPQLHEGISKIHISLFNKLKLLKQGTGLISKLLYAFLF